MNQDCVLDHFSENALEWARHYEGGGLALRAFNAVFRLGLKDRFNATMRRAAPVEGRTFLDVGCGSGVYSLTLAMAGAKEVVGIDFAPGMIELAARAAEDNGLSERCRFIEGDFLETDFDDEFDLVFAMGVLEYFEDPEPLWRKMARTSRNMVMASFPGHAPLREPIRKWRYTRKGLPLYFYSRERVEALGCAPELARYEVEMFGSAFGRGYVLTGFVG